MGKNPKLITNMPGHIRMLKNLKRQITDLAEGVVTRAAFNAARAGLTRSVQSTQHCSQPKAEVQRKNNLEMKRETLK